MISYASDNVHANRAARAAGSQESCHTPINTGWHTFQHARTEVGLQAFNRSAVESFPV